ncbi:hypothetical protein PCL_00321 [Purpureocillium lilacinum]|uniref:Uncharacterized protein n=1 Tax=Purpureocillium lilacinum TaxID=33203 RepID=A0A2U3E6R9_PURLI|nr:hypothetical protein PCL_00321 [Purpureocillium lilacinum]
MCMASMTPCHSIERNTSVVLVGPSRRQRTAKKGNHSAPPPPSSRPAWGRLRFPPPSCLHSHKGRHRHGYPASLLSLSSRPGCAALFSSSTEKIPQRRDLTHASVIPAPTHPHEANPHHDLVRDWAAPTPGDAPLLVVCVCASAHEHTTGAGSGGRGSPILTWPGGINGRVLQLQLLLLKSSAWPPAVCPPLSIHARRDAQRRRPSKVRAARRERVGGPNRMLPSYDWMS